MAIFFSIVMLGALFRPPLPEEPRSYDPEQVRIIEEKRNFSELKTPPRLQVPVDLAEGETAPWFPKSESPLLTPLVEEGTLPPVAERVGPEPLVLQGVEGIGSYGGTWNRVAGSSGDVGIITWRMSAANLFRWSPMGEPVVPHIARGYEVNDDFTEWTIYLRRGVRWSDGEPFDADDILYWYEKEALYFSPDPPKLLMHQGKEGNLEKVDDYTLRFRFHTPHTTFLQLLASPHTRPFAPAHYMQDFHPEGGDPDKIAAAMKAKGIDNPRSLYFSMKSWQNVDLPQMWPWIYRVGRSSSPQTFVRNPYYYAVDSEGNQLPYIDRVVFHQKAEQLIPLSAAGGDVDMQTRSIRFADYTMLMQQQEAGDYRLYHWFPASRSVWALFPNINRASDPDDPVSTWKRTFLRKKEFRQALSLAIDRERIIEAEYSGIGTPSQIEPGPASPYHHPGLAKAFTEFDPQRAAEMLDAMGLDQRDPEGMRTFPDGTRMSWYLDFTDFTGEGPVQFVVEDWRNLGIRAVQRERARPLFATEKSALQHDFTIWTGESEFDPMVQPRSFVPYNSESHFAPAYGNWYNRGGLYGLVDGKNEGIQEPPVGSPARQAMDLLEKAQRAVDSEERLALVNEILQINAEEVWSISIATPPPQLVVVANQMRNVPQVALFGAAYNTPGNAGIDTYYLERPDDSEGIVAASRDSLVNPIHLNQDMAAGAGSPGVGKQLGRLMRWGFRIALVLGIFTLAIRHPFIGRRLVVLMPSLLITSIIAFTMIQLPPGSFVETKILQLRMAGDEAGIEDVERLVEQFRLNDPGWKQYVRWMGFPWFLSFDEEDKGLLQGYMGRSMENGQSVNDLVGDRVMMTFFVSLGTIIFTWMTALPIAIYSAVRQYSISDYVITFLGFIGMCVPNFLLAILIMFWSNKYLGLNVTGLFSAEYAADPTWSLGKVIDLLKHIWVPIVIIGTAGTAGMIRVMRSNLLDELKKPYVTTARAKGVRPKKLLLKYPVRLALNPFISGIGGIFPQLVSGGAIVAIVLSLPMVGPLMLQSLMTQDMYMAASLLMMFSFLGVLGTLFSDLMLLWVDPRIRMEGGKR